MRSRVSNSTLIKTPGAAAHQVWLRPTFPVIKEKYVGPIARPSVPALMKTAIARPRLAVIPSVAFAVAWGWKEAIPAPPIQTMASRVQYPGAKPSEEMKMAATAGARAVNRYV